MTYAVEVEDSDTVLKMKQILCGRKGFQLEQVSLIYKSKLLQDSWTVAECGFDEGAEDEEVIVGVLLRPL